MHAHRHQHNLTIAHLCSTREREREICTYMVSRSRRHTDKLSLLPRRACGFPHKIYNEVARIRVPAPCKHSLVVLVNGFRSGYLAGPDINLKRHFPVLICHTNQPRPIICSGRSCDQSSFRFTSATWSIVVVVVSSLPFSLTLAVDTLCE